MSWGLPPPDLPTLTGSIRQRRIDLQAGALFTDAVVEDCDLGAQRAPIFQTADSRFERCDFSRLRIDAGNMGIGNGSTYLDCTFRRADLSRAGPAVVRFERCRFEHTKIDRWFGFQAEFVDCTFVGRFRTIRFYGSVYPDEIAVKIGRSANEFRGNDFRGAELSDVEFVGGIDIDAQAWPDNPDYRHIDHLGERLMGARGVVERWPEPDRDWALEELARKADVFRGQSSMIRRTGQLSARGERLWDAIANAPRHP